MFSKNKKTSLSFCSLEGLIAQLANLSSEQNIFFVIDKKVLKLYPSLKQKNMISVTANEKLKSLESFESIVTQLLEKEIKRTDSLVIIGGGSLIDSLGFVASTLFRGIPYYSVPTTYLSQIDSAHGGKTALNLNDYKNIIGSFYPPK